MSVGDRVGNGDGSRCSPAMSSHGIVPRGSAATERGRDGGGAMDGDGGATTEGDAWRATGGDVAAGRPLAGVVRGEGCALGPGAAERSPAATWLWVAQPHSVNVNTVGPMSNLRMPPRTPAGCPTFGAAALRNRTSGRMAA